MKYCPQCHKQYTEVWITFCSDDGTILVDTDLNQSSSSGQRPPYAPPIYEQPTWRSPDPNAPGAWVPPEARPAPSPVWQPPLPPSANAAKPSQGLAVASMLVGIVGLVMGTFCLGPLPGIAALILGLVALSQMKKTPNLNSGKPFAIIGIVTGSMSILFYGVIILLAIIGNIFS